MRRLHTTNLIKVKSPVTQIFCSIIHYTSFTYWVSSTVYVYAKSLTPHKCSINTTQNQINDESNEYGQNEALTLITSPNRN